MEKDLRSLSKIFTERLYRIPDYQRGYAWTVKQLKDFWGDLELLEKRKNHYLGVLTLEEVSDKVVKHWTNDYWIIESKSYSPYYIVDGQQRLTTLIILIQAILESVNVNDKLNYNTLDEIRKKFIFDSKDEGISKSYIFGYEKDNPSYEFLKTKIFNEFSETGSLLQETVYTHNLEYAKEFFVEKLRCFSHESKEDLYQKITQNLLFNLYTISNDIDVCITFETMNNRGKALSDLELLKNRLIYLSTRFNVEEYEKLKLRHSINEAWKTIYHNLGKNKEHPLDDDNFLTNHFLVYFGKKILKKDDDTLELKIYDYRQYFYARSDCSNYLLEKKFTVKNVVGVNHFDKQPNEDNNDDSITINDVYSYVQSLQQSVVLWYEIKNPHDSNFSEEEKIWFDKLNRVGRYAISAAPLMMIFLQKEKDCIKRTKFLKVLENLAFLRLLASHPTFGIYAEADLLVQAIDLSSGSITVDKLIKEREEERSKLVNDPKYINEIKAEFKSDGFYKWNGIRYFLYEYDLYLQSKSKTKRKKIDWDLFSSHDYKTVEHIYPQNPKKECWISKFNHYTPLEKKILRNSLGNLLPLSQPKNSSFGNKCFVEKIFNNENTVGYRFGSYSEIEVSQYDDWTAKEILQRGIKLLNFMEQRWKIDLGNDKEKIDFLNLEFVVKKENLSY